MKRGVITIQLRRLCGCGRSPDGVPHASHPGADLAVASTVICLTSAAETLSTQLPQPAFHELCCLIAILSRRPGRHTPARAYSTRIAEAKDRKTHPIQHAAGASAASTFAAAAAAITVTAVSASVYA
eukprot:CAMPEP_0181232852 /NCGR_PEP_ID=MMETSP1096-20121128/35986_1 /TAXON_ID=156174 ORGANISM="Chrysochromulina ericina, Strain CCMP281" /NCGR_SAMPLE_ID=MMETSP1096 /ASSEMBLY_ACC=CAM_ASM_000453 /LENGTH=126 /DNA_ID=CAMNT_0023327239 /DNA_START=233 /DNA_END=609 /DNA_ORIENTATION=+